MVHRSKLFSLGALSCMSAVTLFATAITAQASDFTVQLGTVKDTRSTDHSAGLMVELKISGGDLAHVETMSADVASATSGSGINLLQHSSRTSTEVIKALNPYNPTNNSLFVRLKLDSPARAEESIAMLTGTLHFLIPILDGASTITVDDLEDNSGEQLHSTVMDDAKASVLILLKREFDRKHLHDVTPSPSPLTAGEKMFQSLIPNIARNIRTPSTIDDKTIAVEVTDPNDIIGGVEFFRKDNSKAVSKWTSVWGNGAPETTTYAFPNDRPADVIVKIFLKTPKTWVAQPFELTNIPLP